MQKSSFKTTQELSDAIRVARGETPADVVFKGAHFLDVFSGEFVLGDVAIFRDRIVGVHDHYSGLDERDAAGHWIVPGFVDAHVHIESSLMSPARFAQSVLPRGTTSVIWDPHEIANVAGVKGIEWALRASANLLLDCFVMIPSCVPSTSPHLELETSGAVLHACDLDRFRGHPRVLGLAEMMNFPGLLSGEEEVLEKLQAFSEAGLLRDGHCPGLSGRDLNAYATAGVHSCHESTRLDEAREKLSKGIQVLIREGSCARDADALLPLIGPRSAGCVSFCSDDRNPLDIQQAGHLDCIVNKGLRLGLDAVDVFRSAAFAPARQFGLGDRGAVAPGYLADLVLVKQLRSGNWRDGMEIVEVWKKGRRISAQELADQAADEPRPIELPQRNLNVQLVREEDFQIRAPKGSWAERQECRVIGVRNGQILTDSRVADLPVLEECISSDLAQDVLKIAVFERHHGTGRRTVGFVQGFGLKKGAVATSVNHDSHNIIVVGASEREMVEAVNRLIEIDGGIVVCGETENGGFSSSFLRLPLGGLMTQDSPDVVAGQLQILKDKARSWGCELQEPFLQLSFLALPVIPSLKITDRGLIDVEKFCQVDVISSMELQGSPAAPSPGSRLGKTFP